MKIDQYISDLLYDHECVIVTDLGGFIANYKAASINPALHLVTPPSKKLAFNASLKNNDGLLANYVAQRSRLSYPEACEIINNYVTDAVKGMRTGQKLKIEKVGVLYFDNEERLQFLPEQNINYLLDSFGMSPVHAPLIKRTAREVSISVPAAAVESHVHDTERTVRTGKRKWKVLEMIPAAAALVVLFLAPPALQEFNTNLSTLLPFSRINEFVEEVKGERPDKAPVIIPYKNPFEIPPLRLQPAKKTPVVTEPASKSNVAPVEKEKPTGESKGIIPAGTKAEEASVLPEVRLIKNEFKSAENVSGYHIIGGCFRSEANAGKYADELKAKNINAVVIGKNSAGFYMVSIFSSSQLNAVNEKLAEMKSRVHQSAWIHKQ